MRCILSPCLIKGLLCRVVHKFCAVVINYNANCNNQSRGWHFGNIYRNAVIVAIFINQNQIIRFRSTEHTWQPLKQPLKSSSRKYQPWVHIRSNAKKSNHHSPAGSKHDIIRTMCYNVKSSYPEPSTSRIEKKLSRERYVYSLSIQGFD